MCFRERVIKELHEGLFTEDLLCADFYYVVEVLMSKTERMIMEHKIQGWEDEKVKELLCITDESYKRYIRSIKKKFRTKVNDRVDDWIRKEEFKRGDTNKDTEGG